MWTKQHDAEEHRREVLTDLISLFEAGRERRWYNAVLAFCRHDNRPNYVGCLFVLFCARAST